MRPEQLGDFKTPSDPQMHPDGNRVVFVVSQMDLERDRYVRRLHLWDGEAMRPLTSGPGDSSPRISPDGKSVAFLRKTEGGHAQVAVLPLDGGEAEVATELPHGATELIWSPDGTRLGLVAAPEDRREDAAEPEELARLPRRITRFPYRFDEVGWLRPSNLHVLDIAEGSLTQITDGDSRDHSIAWHPDGSEIAFAAARHETAGLDQGAQLWTVPVAGGAASARTAVGLWEAPTYDASGALHAVGGGPVGSDPSVHPSYVSARTVSRPRCVPVSIATSCSTRHSWPRRCRSGWTTGPRSLLWKIEEQFVSSASLGPVRGLRSSVDTEWSLAQLPVGTGPQWRLWRPR